MADNNQKESFSKISIQLAFLSPSKNMTLFEKLICSASDSRYPYVELIIDSKHSQDIDYEKLFVSSLKISNKSLYFG